MQNNVCWDGHLGVMLAVMDRVMLAGIDRVVMAVLWWGDPSLWLGLTHEELGAHP